MAAEKKKSTPLLNAIMAIAAVIVIACLKGIGIYAYSYIEGQQKYSRIADISGFDTDRLFNDIDDADLDKVHVDWDALRAVNPDIVAWIYVHNTAINYPVVQGTDNYEYLYKDFDGDQGWLAQYGCVFMEAANKNDWSDSLYFIYGHHMADGSMFASLSALQYQDGFNASRTVYLLTPKGNFKLRSICLYHCLPADPIVFQNFNDDKEMIKYIRDKIDNASARANEVINPEKMKKVFALSTCDDYSAGRYTLYCYIEATNAKGLEGEIGIADDENGRHFIEDVEV